MDPGNAMEMNKMTLVDGSATMASQLEPVQSAFLRKITAIGKHHPLKTRQRQTVRSARKSVLILLLRMEHGSVETPVSSVSAS